MPARHSFARLRWPVLAGLLVAATGAAGLLAPAASAAGSSFVTGQLQGSTVGQAGCGTNVDGEPTIHVSRAATMFIGSERGVGSGSDGWRQPTVTHNGGSACAPTYIGQPDAVQGAGASGGDIDSSWGSAKGSSGTYPLYVSSLNLGSIYVAVSTDDGRTFSQTTPVQGGIPVDDREWIAAYGSHTALLSYHDIATGNIDVLRSDNTGQTFVQTGQAIAPTDYRAMNNELGNLVIDRRNTAGTVAGQAAPAFWAYQTFVAPSTSSGSAYNEAFLAVSNDGGYTWTDRAIPCSTAGSGTGLDHNFPNASVAPDGSIWYAWSDDHAIRTAVSHDHGASWSCSKAVSGSLPHSIFPWLVATSNGVDLVFYGTPASTVGSSSVWSVYFVQDLASTTGGWSSPKAVVAVHRGQVCEGGVSCTGGRQLFDDFGIDTDPSGWAHIAYSHDSPNLGGSGTYTGYAAQTAGQRAGYPN